MACIGRMVRSRCYGTVVGGVGGAGVVAIETRAMRETISVGQLRHGIRLHLAPTYTHMRTTLEYRTRIHLAHAGDLAHAQYLLQVFLSLSFSLFRYLFATSITHACRINIFRILLL